ncbi:methyltransferase [Streptomyces sp. PmtG]
MRKSTAAVGSSVFLALAPGVVAGVVPWWLTRWEAGHWWGAVRVVGGVVLVVAGAVLAHAFARFVTEGLGTPAPVLPTEHLVVGGLYRHVRNPMYVAVVAAIAGQGLLLARPVLLGYGLVAGAAMGAFARWYEEPALLRAHGARYARYRAGVPAFLPRLRPWRG